MITLAGLALFIPACVPSSVFSFWALFFVNGAESPDCVSLVKHDAKHNMLRRDVGKELLCSFCTVANWLNMEIQLVFESLTFLETFPKVSLSMYGKINSVLVKVKFWFTYNHQGALD